MNTTQERLKAMATARNSLETSWKERFKELLVELEDSAAAGSYHMGVDVPFEDLALFFRMLSAMGLSYVITGPDLESEALIFTISWG